MRLASLAGFGLIAALFAAVPAQAADAAIPGYGAFTPLPQAHEQADPAVDYKVVFDVSGAAKAPDQVNPGLDRAARLVNILIAAGVPAEKRHLAIVVHGPATDAVAGPAAFAQRHQGAANPNAALLKALQAAGVSVRICGQAMLARKLAPEDLAPGVQVDLAALMTVVHLQLDGYALVSD